MSECWCKLERIEKGIDGCERYHMTLRVRKYVMSDVLWGNEIRPLLGVLLNIGKILIFRNVVKYRLAKPGEVWDLGAVNAVDDVELEKIIGRMTRSPVGDALCRVNIVE